MHSLKLIFMGSPSFALPAFEALINAGHQIVAAYTSVPKPAGRGQKLQLSPVHEMAALHNIPVYIPSSLKDLAAQEEFKSHHADAAVVAAYGLLLPEAILSATPMGCINIHPSLLPRWRGAAPIQRCIMAGDTETGTVIMQMNKGLDTGDILMVKRIKIPDGTNATTLHDLLAELSAPLLLETLEGLATKTITPTPQPEEGVMYAQKILKSESPIDWSLSAKTIRQKILGLAPHPAASFVYNQEIIKILDAEIISSTSAQIAGTVIDEQLTIKCGDDAIRPLLLQRPGKKVLALKDFLQGFTIPVGTVLT